MKIRKPLFYLIVFFSIKQNSQIASSDNQPFDIQLISRVLNGISLRLLISRGGIELNKQEVILFKELLSENVETLKCSAPSFSVEIKILRNTMP